MANESLQRTLDWHRQRLGKITGSEVADLMKHGRGKNEVWSQTAISYMLRKAAERCLDPDFVANDEQFGYWLNVYNGQSKPMAYGSRMESVARSRYSVDVGSEITDVGSCVHPLYPFFAASPDGLVGANGVLELKCPSAENFARYKVFINSAEDLKNVRPDYYWQCLAEMSCTGRLFADFVAYSDVIEGCPVHIVHIERPDEDIAEMHQRISDADEMIKFYVEQIRK